MSVKLCVPCSCKTLKTVKTLNVKHNLILLKNNLSTVEINLDIFCG